jgi:hypothetical protein
MESKDRRSPEEFFRDLFELFPLKEGDEQEYDMIRCSKIPGATGAFSIVLKTTNLKTGEVFAMEKFISKLIETDDEAEIEHLHSLETEVKFLKKVDFPLLLKFIDSFRDTD